MSRGPVSVQMLARKQRIPGAAQFLHLSLVSLTELGQSNNGTPRLWCCYYKLTEPKTHAKKGEGCEDYTLCWTESVSRKPLTEKPAFQSWKTQSERLSHFGI